MPRPLIALLVSFCSALAQAHGGAEPAASLSGLSGPVQLTRDRSGITHVQARSEADLWFMQGFVHARDRLFQMDEFRRTASGTLAAVSYTHLRAHET